MNNAGESNLRSRLTYKSGIKRPTSLKGSRLAQITILHTNLHQKKQGKGTGSNGVCLSQVGRMYPLCLGKPGD